MSIHDKYEAGGNLWHVILIQKPECVLNFVWKLGLNINGKNTTEHNDFGEKL